ncbi:hypothetical protein AB0764_26920 (plasmid) [Priestia megaterium]|uniref:hypothetical protein n=1 Tax=Priestia megaterium TaxID=1404 RepID=UPI00351F0F2F
MKKIDAVMKIFYLDELLTELFKDLYEKGLTNIYETFDCLKDLKKCAYVFLDPDVYGDDLSVHLTYVFEIGFAYDEFVDETVAKQPDMNEEMDSEDIIELCMSLADVECERYNIHGEWKEMGVDFKIADNKLIVDLIGELVGKDVSKTLHNYSSYQILDDDLREDLKAKLSETS